MRKIIAYQVVNPTPHRPWDWVAHYEGDCEDYEHQDPIGHGDTEQSALEDFELAVAEKIECDALRSLPGLNQKQLLNVRKYALQLITEISEKEDKKLEASI